MKSLGLVSVFAAMLVVASACTARPSPTAVRGIESEPGGAWKVAYESRGVSEPTASRNGTYMGASADGSYLGFIYPDGTIRWYRR